jgi:hypothetical protein
MTKDLIHIASAADAAEVARVRSACQPYLARLYQEGVLAGYWLVQIQNDEEAKAKFVDADTLAMVNRRFPFLYARVNLDDESRSTEVLEELTRMGFVDAFA